MLTALPPALQALAAYPQFLCYKLVPSTKKPGKMDKFPVNPKTGYVCSAHDPAAWTDHATAIAAALAWGPQFGLAYSFQTSDPFFFVDIDGAHDGREWSPLSRQILEMFPGAAVEVSQSGTGLHIIGRGTAPPHGCKNPAGLEFYTQERFCALTGIHAYGDANTDHTAALHALTISYFPAGEGTGLTGDWSEDWTEKPVAGWRGPTDDEELIRRALRSESAAGVFGSKATFRELWEGNQEAIARAFPEDGASAADAALAQHLAFWTGNDCARIERLMRRSGLYREKWEREDYLPRTINGRTGAVRRQVDILQDKVPEPLQLGVPQASGEVMIGASIPMAVATTGNTFLAPAAQAEFFAGCVYIRDVHKVYSPDGDLLKPDQFKASYGGYAFAMDSANEKVTRNAWEAFTESQVLRFPKAHTTCFRPEAPPGALLQEEGRTLLNVYVPIQTRRIQGDPAPFLQLLGLLLPDERDRRIILSYMAAVVQNPGRKFQWWPVLQGTEGNGKTILIRVMSHAVGHRYTHLPNTHELAKSGGKFNSWLRHKLFVGMEEIYVAERRDFLEAFKPYVTNDRLEIEGKGADQIMGDNRANGMMCTNHKDGVPVTTDSRRYPIFYTQQQRAEDLVACGMTGSYFPTLYQWLKGEGAYASGGPSYGYAIVADFLASYPVEDEFNPAGMCQIAPRTSSSMEAVARSRGRVEQEVIEAIEQGVIGFRGGWISSAQLEALLERKGRGGVMAPNKRRDMLKSLGYDYHPGLRDGRTDNTVLPDGCKPRLFVRPDHPSIGMTSAADVARAYQQAQTAG